MTLKNRLEKLEKQIGGDVEDVDMLKPSEILARADELTAAGGQSTPDQARAIESIRQVTHVL